MKIAEHCKPGGWRHRTMPYTPRHPWPEDAYIQWGKGFIEVFIGEIFLRRSGETIQDCEDNAWNYYSKIINCSKHEFERRDYKNGGGICKHCGLFKMAFEPLTKCKVCEKPTNWAFFKKEWFCEEHIKEQEGYLDSSSMFD